MTYYTFKADFVLADTPEKLFPKSNLKEATAHCKKEVAKADKQGYRDELDKQVKDRIDRGVLKELTEKEKSNLKIRLIILLLTVWYSTHVLDLRLFAW